MEATIMAVPVESHLGASARIQVWSTPLSTSQDHLDLECREYRLSTIQVVSTRVP